MSEKKELNQEELEKVNGGAYANYSNEVDDASISNYLGYPLYFVGNQTFVGSSYVQYVEVFASLDSVGDKTYENKNLLGLTIRHEDKYVTKRVYTVKILSGNCKAGDIMDLVAEGFKVYLSKD